MTTTEIHFPCLTGNGKTTILDTSKFKHDKLKNPVTKKVLGKFLGFKLINPLTLMDQIDLDPNMEIRANHLGTNEVNDIKDSFKANGYNAEEYPPLVDKEGKLRDGRHRIKAAADLHISLFPVAVYDWDEDVTDEEKRDFDFVANVNHLPRNRYKKIDYVYRGFRKIQNGTLIATIDDIEDWLYNKSGATAQFTNNNGDLTSIRNQIMARNDQAELGEKPTKIFSQEQAKAWVSENVKSNSPTIPVDAGNGGFQHAHLAWTQHILKHNAKGDIPNIVFYTKKSIHSQAQEALSTTVATLDRLHQQTIRYTNNAIDGIEISATKKPKMYNILGVIPQNETYHKRYIDSKQLVPIDQY
jgi:hypothetical protein